KAPYLVAVAAARAMRKQPVADGLQGKIVNFADWAVERPYKGFLPYFIAKGGVVTMTRALAVELAPTITVNAIAPAMIDPPPNLSPQDIEEIRQTSPLKRIGIPSDANNLVLYLLEGTDFATGAVYRVDGGRVLGTDAEGPRADQERGQRRAVEYTGVSPLVCSRIRCTKGFIW